MKKVFNYLIQSLQFKKMIVFAMLLAVVSQAQAQWSTGTNKVYISSPSTQVGIGTNAPEKKLHVKGGAILMENDEGMKALFGTIRVTNDTLNYIGPINNYGVGIGTNSNVQMVVKKDGKVGIGTITPAYKLQVEGQTYLNNTVGVGTAPVSDIQLKVKGSFHVENSTGNQVFHISAGKELVFVGADAYNEYLAAQSDPNSAIEENNYSLWVSKGIVSEDFSLADVSDWDDYVFNEDYHLMSLAEVATFIKANGHLPNIPSAATVKKQGYSLHTLNRGFLKTIEELTLYGIAQDKKISELEARLNEQQDQITAQAAQLKAFAADLAAMKKKDK